jgi:ATP-dependent NAD(P)H-hydrate dehydratase
LRTLQHDTPQCDARLKKPWTHTHREEQKEHTHSSNKNKLHEQMSPPPLIHPRHPLSLATKIASIRSSLTPFSFATIATAAHPLRIRIKASNTRIILTTTAASSHNPFFPFPSTHCLPRTNNSNYSILSRTMTTLNQRQKEAATMPTYPEYRSLVPPLSASLYKGQGGKITSCAGTLLLSQVPFITSLYLLFLSFSI